MNARRLRSCFACSLAHTAHKDAHTHTDTHMDLLLPKVAWPSCSCSCSCSISSAFHTLAHSITRSHPPPHPRPHTPASLLLLLVLPSAGFSAPPASASSPSFFFRWFPVPIPRSNSPFPVPHFLSYNTPFVNLHLNLVFHLKPPSLGIGFYVSHYRNNLFLPRRPSTHLSIRLPVTEAQYPLRLVRLGYRPGISPHRQGTRPSYTTRDPIAFLLHIVTDDIRFSTHQPSSRSADLPHPRFSWRHRVDGVRWLPACDAPSFNLPSTTATRSATPFSSCSKIR